MATVGTLTTAISIDDSQFRVYTKEMILNMYRVPVEMFDQMEQSSSLQFSEVQRAWVGKSLFKERIDE